MSKALTITPSFKEIKAKILALIADKDKRRKVLERAALELKDLAAGVPRQGPWNRYPGNRNDGRWYQRRYGPRWATKSYTGKSGAGISGRNTSQDIEFSWQIEIQRRDEFTASVFTEVTYAPFLLDETRRVHWANSHGWQTLDSIEKDYTPRFEKIILDELDKQIEKI